MLPDVSNYFHYNMFRLSKESFDIYLNGNTTDDGWSHEIFSSLRALNVTKWSSFEVKKRTRYEINEICA